MILFVVFSSSIDLQVVDVGFHSVFSQFSDRGSSLKPTGVILVITGLWNRAVGQCVGQGGILVLVGLVLVGLYW